MQILQTPSTETGCCLSKRQVHLLFDPAIPLLGTCCKDFSLHIQTDVCLRLLITAMLLIAKVWNQLKYATAGNLLNKLQVSHVMEYYAAVKRSEEVLYVLTETKLQEVLSEKKQSAG